MYKKILIPIDITREQNAIKLCKVGQSLVADGAEVRLFSVIPGYGMPLVASFFPEEMQDKAKEEVRQALQNLANNNLQCDSSVAVQSGKRAKEILAQAADWQPDLIIIGSRQKASQNSQRVMGACSTGVADRSECSVLIIR